jgi:hypothetical protein
MRSSPPDVAIPSNPVGPGAILAAVGLGVVKTIEAIGHVFKHS